MKLKDNFVQAAKELMGTPEDTDKKEKDKSPAQAEPKGKDKLDERVSALQSMLSGKGQAAPATVIGEGAVFTGNLETNGPVELHGTFNGNITSKEELKLAGRLVGDASGSTVIVGDCRLRGNITAQKDVRIDGTSMVIGNVTADSLSLNGKVKGDLTIKRTLVLESNAALFGNASAASISIQEGAVFQGEMRITSADLNAMFKNDEA